MTSLPERIFRILEQQRGPITTKDLARALGLRSDRLLRGTGDDMGEIERAKSHAFKYHRRLILTTHRGIQIVDDVALAEQLMMKKIVHAAHEQRSMAKDKLRIRHLGESTSQPSLFAS